VVTVNVDVPAVTEVGLRLHVGEFAPAGETAQVRATVPLNPLTAATVTVEVAEPPAFTELGERAAAVMVKLEVTD
jgi:hypothetical protein